VSNSTTTPHRAQGVALERFSSCLPFNAMATDNFKFGAYLQPKNIASQMAEIAPDPEGWKTALRLDVDRADASTSWMDAGLPEPSFIVVNPANGHAHLTWQLADWIDESKGRSLRYFNAVRNAFTEATGADAKYAGRFMHNPLSSKYAVIRGRSRPFTLAELATCVDLGTGSNRPTSAQGESTGRNCKLFDAVRQEAYRTVTPFRLSRRYEDFLDHVLVLAKTVNASLQRTLPISEIRSHCTLNRTLDLGLLQSPSRQAPKRHAAVRV